MATRSVSVAVSWFVAAVTASVLLLSFAGRAEGPPRTQTVLIFPFENFSRMAKLDWLSEGLSELTAERLAAQGLLVFPREERLATLEKLGLPTSARFSRATMLKIAEEIDADQVVFGQYTSDGRNFSVAARVLRVYPPSLGPAIEESGALDDLMDMHARLAWRVLSSVEPTYPLSQRDFAQKVPRLRLDAFEYYMRGLMNSKEEQRLRDFHEAARLEPAWDDPAFALGQTYYTRRDCESALPWLSRVPPAHERGPEASFDAGVCHLLRNDPSRAEAAFANLLERARPSTTEGRELPEALNNLAVAKDRLGKPSEAAISFRRAAQLDPEDVDYWFNLGLAELRMNEPTGAVTPFREALHRRPEDAEAHALLVAALERSGRGSEAAAEREGWNRAGGRGPAVSPSLSPESLARLERIKMRVEAGSLRPLPAASGEVSAGSAEESARRPTHRQLHLTRGRQFLAAGNLEAAQREFAEAVVLAPRDAAAHQGLAEVYRRQGRPEDAIREMRVALASRDDPAAHTQLARLYLEQKRIVEAREELRLALKLDPGYAEARHLLDQLEGRPGSGEP